MPRKLPEWVGATPDSAVPPRVRRRVYDRYIGICHICGLAINGKKWAADHVIALIAEGENRESNLKPAHIKCNLAKAAIEVAEKAKVAAIRAKHSGAKRPEGKMQGAGFQKAEKPQPSRKATLPRRDIFTGRLI